MRNYENWANEILENELSQLKPWEIRQKIFDIDEKDEADALVFELERILDKKQFLISQHFDRWRWYIVEIKKKSTPKIAELSNVLK